MVRRQILTSPFGEVTVLWANPPRIQARDPLAVDWGLGWWHAREHGSEALVARAFWRQWDQTPPLAEETAGLAAGHRARVHAYTQGFNQGRKKSKEPPWTVEDCHRLVRSLGVLEWWEQRASQMEFLRQALREGVSWARLVDLWPELGPGAPSEPPLEIPSMGPEAASWDKIRRFRPSTSWTVGADRSLSGRPLWATTSISDVTEPGLPFFPVLLESDQGQVRGLSRPGHPGFLIGRTARLAWGATPVTDDIMDWRVRSDGPVGTWVGGLGRGTLGALLALESCATVEEAQDQTSGMGSACLDFTAVDALGGTATWAHGLRWHRVKARQTWLPNGADPESRPGPRTRPTAAEPGSGRWGAPDLAKAVVQDRWLQVEEALALVRFLLPDSDTGQKLRRWTGSPLAPEAAVFERVYREVVAEFWSGCPHLPGPESPVRQALVPVVDRLILAPHSAWLPSQEKNRRLAEAVRRAFAPGVPPGPPVLARRAVRACWKETGLGKPRVFAATVAVVVDMSEDTWRVFLTDDETEVPSFQVW